MMINKRLIGTVSESKKYIAGNVILQWCSLAANIAMMFSITGLFAGLYYGNTTSLDMQRIFAIQLIRVHPQRQRRNSFRGSRTSRSIPAPSVCWPYYLIWLMKQQVGFMRFPTTLKP